MTRSSIKLKKVSLANLECVCVSAVMCEGGTHRCVVSLCIELDPSRTLWRFEAFNDSTGTEIKPVKALCCQSLITPDHADLDETRVTQPIRRSDSPPPRQLSHDTPINLPKRIPESINPGSAALKTLLSAKHNSATGVSQLDFLSLPTLTQLHHKSIMVLVTFKFREIIWHHGMFQEWVPSGQILKRMKEEPLHH